MKLDPRLEQSSTLVHELSLCQVRLATNASFPWILLIPKHSNISEIIDLSEADQQTLITEIALCSKVMQRLFKPTKLNVASLGNVVPQLHIHIIARYDTDPAWPNPVWNTVSSDYSDGELTHRMKVLQDAFTALS